MGIHSLLRFVAQIHDELAGGNRQIRDATGGLDVLNDSPPRVLAYLSPIAEQNDTLRLLLKLAGVTLVDESSEEPHTTLVQAVSLTDTQIDDACRKTNAPSVRVVSSTKEARVPDTVEHVVLPASIHDLLA